MRYPTAWLQWDVFPRSNLQSFTCVTKKNQSVEERDEVANSGVSSHQVVLSRLAGRQEGGVVSADFCEPVQGCLGSVAKKRLSVLHTVLRGGHLVPAEVHREYYNYFTNPLPLKRSSNVIQCYL
jgi:hypothetical protein